jgi:hypothetical protein
MSVDLPELRRLPDEYREVILRMPAGAADAVRELLRERGALSWGEILECLNGAKHEELCEPEG